MSYFRTSQPEAAVFHTRHASTKWQRNQNTVAFVPKASIGPVTHTVLVALLITVLGLIYLSQVTKTSTFGYTLQSQTEQMAALTVQRQDLEVENARLQALTKVKDSSVAKAMTAPVSTDIATN